MSLSLTSLLSQCQPSFLIPGTKPTEILYVAILHGFVPVDDFWGSQDHSYGRFESYSGGLLCSDLCILIVLLKMMNAIIGVLVVRSC